MTILSSHADPRSATLAGESGALANERPYLLGVAYRMLGSQSDAEDVVQEALLRMSDARDIASPRAYLTTVVTRLCLDELRSARRRRETYVGPHLPEPVFTARLDAPAEHGVSHQEDVSLAFLILLDRLTPRERAVFVLREVFELPFAEIATAIGRSEPACRKLLSRARAQLDQSPRNVSPAHAQLAVASAFFQALASGDTNEVLKLLADDAFALTDHGGKVSAARKPVHGAERVARFIVGLVQKGARAPAAYEALPSELNGAPALVVWGPDAQPQAAFMLRIESTAQGDRITALMAIRNPDKLRAIASRRLLEI